MRTALRTRPQSAHGHHSHVVRVGDCPACTTSIVEPFSRVSGPVAFLHRRRGERACRLIVWPDASPGGAAHRVWPVPPTRSMESALQEAVTMALGQHRERRGVEREAEPRGAPTYEAEEAPEYEVASPPAYETKRIVNRPHLTSKAQ